MTNSEKDVALKLAKNAASSLAVVEMEEFIYELLIHAKWISENGGMNAIQEALYI